MSFANHARSLAPVLVVLALAGVVHATEKQLDRLVTIRVDDMHCAACAKKIARKLYAVPGVVKVKADLKKHTAYALPEERRDPCPYAIWDAVEQAGFQVVELTCPAGTFDEKPEPPAEARPRTTLRR